MPPAQKLTSVPGCSLVISTYNWPAALRLCLQSVREQTLLPNEVIIADDGSGEETRVLIEKEAKDFPVPLRHVWQPDKGYQLARIRNRAFATARYDYIIQMDGDLLLHPQFVADHMAVKQENCFVSGTRSLIGAELTKDLLQQGRINWPAVLSSKLGKPYNARRSTLLRGWLYHLQRGKKNVDYVLGCNMAFWKRDLETVNGYNESFTGWGKEDNDIAIRLVNAGKALRFLKFGGIVYHLFHKEAARPTLAENESLLRKSVVEQITYIRNGMDQYCEQVN